MQGSQEIIANNTINGVNKGPELGSFSAINIQIRGANNKVIGNQITSDGMAGVDVFGSNSIVYGNSIFAGPNAIGGIPGVQLEYNSSGITIAKNNLVNTSINIETATSFNVVCGNTIGGAISFMGFNNSFYGNTLTWRVFIGGTHGGSVDAANNLFCNNNFMVNSPEVEVFTGSPGTEFWDNGAVGNYWSNYAGQDSDNNGIGDQLYLVTTSYSTTGYTSGNIGYDHYPLMLPFDTSSITVSAPQWITPVFNPPTYNPKPTDTPSSTPQNTLLPQPSPSTTNSPIPSVSLKPNPPGNSSQPSVLAELLPVVVFAVLVGLIFAIIVFLKKQRSR